MEYTKDITLDILYAKQKKKQKKHVTWISSIIALVILLSAIDFFLLSYFIQILQLC